MFRSVKFAGRRRGRRAFVSQWTGAETGGRLESRALTAPAFFMLSPGTPGRRYDVTASIGGDGQLLPLSTNQGTTSIENSGEGVQNQFGMPNIVIGGLVTSDWEDVDNAGGPGSTPVGALVISGNVASELHGNHVGFVPGIPATLGTTGASNRTYVLADTSATPAAPVTLVERFHVDYTASAGPTFTSALAATLATATAGVITVTGGANGITNVLIGGTNYAVGTVGAVNGATLPGALPSVITFSSASTAADFTITTVFPNGLPTVTATNPVGGIAFNVWTNVAHGLVDTGNGPPGQNPQGQTGLTTATTHYDARFAV